MAWNGVEIGCRAGRCLVFLPGFLAPASAYRGLLAPLAFGSGWHVRIAQVYRPGVRALAGRPCVDEEASHAASIVQDLAARGNEVWLGGHSRGGQAAWLAAESCSPGGLMVVDPVDGSGPGSLARTTSRPPAFDVVPLIVGAGVGGPCAPGGLNHERFAAAAPRRIHAVLPECAHADVLAGGPLRLGRLLCGAGPDPRAARRTVSALMAAHLADRLSDRAVDAAAAPDPPPAGDGVPAQVVEDRAWPSRVLWC